MNTFPFNFIIILAVFWTTNPQHTNAKDVTPCIYRKPPSGMCQTQLYRFKINQELSIWGNDVAIYGFTSIANCYELCLSDNRCYGVDISRSTCYINNAATPLGIDRSMNSSLLDCCNSPGILLSFTGKKINLKITIIMYSSESNKLFLYV
jgi:hypothetical protein